MKTHNAIQLITTALVTLAGSSALEAQTTMFLFGSSAAYVSGKTGFGGTDPRYESGNQAFRNTTNGAAQTGGARAYSETYSLTGPAAGIASGSGQTFSGYSGPVVFGGYAIANQSTATFATAHNPSIGYGSTSATATSGTYFQTGLRNGTTEAGTFDRLVVNAGFGGSPVATAAGNRAYTISALFTAQLDQPVNFVDGSSISYVVAGTSNARAVVKIGSQYYVSDFANNSAGTGTITASFDSAQLTTGNWSLYDPLAGVAYASASSTTLDLGSVSYAGVLLTRTVSQAVALNGTLSANFAEVSLTELAVTAAPIPEPSAFAALAGLGVLGLAAARRRHHRGN